MMNTAPEKFADLHLHTVFSDGTFTPERLLQEALRCGLSAISIVDHDTVDGIKPVLEAAKGKDIEVIPGIELTAEYENSEIHILGYLIDYENIALIEKLNSLKEDRVGRIYKMVDKLNKMGLKLSADSVFALAKTGIVGRLHVARAMLKEGLISYTTEAFQKYIGDKCPAYIGGFRFSPHEAIGLIRNVGGLAVLAHPYILNRDDLILKFIDYGILGLEAYYPEHTQGAVNYYLDFAKKHNLLVTGGSDCHGEAKPEIKIGSLKIPYSLVEALKAAKEKLR